MNVNKNIKALSASSKSLSSYAYTKAARENSVLSFYYYYYYYYKK